MNLTAVTVIKMRHIPKKPFNEAFMRPVLAPIPTIGQLRLALILRTEANIKPDEAIHAWHTGRWPGTNTRILPR